MQKIMNGVWFNKKPVNLTNYKATYNGRVYNILAVDQEMANQKAHDHFQTNSQDIIVYAN
jgi:hypothetical protein